MPARPLTPDTGKPETGHVGIGRERVPPGASAPSTRHLPHAAYRRTMAGQQEELGRRLDDLGRALLDAIPVVVPRRRYLELVEIERATAFLLWSQRRNGDMSLRDRRGQPLRGARVFAETQGDKA